MEIRDFNGGTDDGAGTAASVRAEIRDVIFSESRPNPMRTY